MKNYGGEGLTLLQVERYSVLLFGFAVCWMRFGLSILDPFNINWLLLGGDPTPDFFAWEFFRISPWDIPPGEFDYYAYPQNPAVGITGAIPLFAFPFKLLSFALPEHFQYHGLWYATCYVLQAWFGWHIFKTLGVKQGWLRYVLTGFILLAVPLLDRTPHINLCAHWIILGQVWVYLSDKDRSTRRNLAYQVIFTVISVMVHPYLILFTVAIAFAHFWAMLERKDIAFIRFVLYNALNIACLLATAWLCGYFALSGGSSQSTGFGHYSANLNTFFHAGNLLQEPFLPKPALATGGQYEGFAYLGAGMFFILLCLVLTLFLKKKVNWKPDPNTGTLWLIAVALALFAVSPVVTLNEYILLKIPLPPFFEKAGAVFRASGRYIWLLFYLVMVFVPVLLLRKWRFHLIAKLVIVVAFAIQVTELYPYMKNSFVPDWPYDSPLKSASWDKIVSDSETIIFFPPFKRTYKTEDDYVHLVQLAFTHRKKITTGHLARNDEKVMYEYFNHLKNALNGTDAREFKDDVFVTVQEYLHFFKNWYAAGQIAVFEINGYFVILPSSRTELITSIRDDEQAQEWRVESQGLADYLEKHHDQIVLLSIRDEGVNKLCEEVKQYMDSLGSNIRNLQFRNSYAAVLAGNKVVAEKIEAARSAQIEVPKGTMMLGNILPFTLQVGSAGMDHGDFCHIVINGEEKCPNSRGMNVVVLDSTFRVRDAVTFDTYETCYRDSSRPLEN